jgi:hypothetical protein
VTAIKLLLLRTWLSVRHGVDIRVAREAPGRMLVDARHTGRNGVHKHLHLGDTDQEVLRLLRNTLPDLVSDTIYANRTAFVLHPSGRSSCGLCRTGTELA